ncbi:MAG TPA: hypothetical protein VM076_10960 [Gemmatimonadaceae bacterium]|nr:hypothetical protein [Gemmatimonadaceae bacterium]
MSSDNVEDGRDELQFDRVEKRGSEAGAATSSLDVSCAVCGKSVGAEYYHANGKPVCASCGQVLQSAAATPRSIGPLLRAGLFGLGGAIAGAAIYYAVIAITDFEIGLVAILIGYMVGYMVRKGAGGRGGRRFQVLAIVLTYWAVGLAYTPLAFKGMRGQRSAAADSTVAPATAAAADSIVSGADSKRDMSLAKALGMLFVMAFALPVLSIASSMPGGILSAIIILIGLRQAWSMTGALPLQMSGPYKVGAAPTPVAE